MAFHDLDHFVEDVLQVLFRVNIWLVTLYPPRHREFRRKSFFQRHHHCTKGIDASTVDVGWSFLCSICWHGFLVGFYEFSYSFRQVRSLSHSPSVMYVTKQRLVNKKGHSMNKSILTFRLWLVHQWRCCCRCPYYVASRRFHVNNDRFVWPEWPATSFLWIRPIVHWSHQRRICHHTTLLHSSRIPLGHLLFDYASFYDVDLEGNHNESWG